MKIAALMRFVSGLFACAALLAPAGCKCPGDGSTWATCQDIMTAARSMPALTTFVAAVEAAGFEGTFHQEGPYTVFAPTNEAFDKLPSGMLENLFLPANKPELVNIVSYHLMVGSFTESEAIRLGRHMTFNGRPISFTSTIRYTTGPTGRPHPEGSPVLLINDRANVIRRNIQCCNGIIQVIDSVLMP